MEFNAIVKTYLLPILQKYEYKITEEFKNIVRFQSSNVKINLVFNEYDGSHFVELGRQGERLYPLNDNAVKKLFDLSLSVEQVTLQIFVQNLCLLFETKTGVEILKGHITPLKNVIWQQSENYTSEVIQQQVLDAASKAWAINDYKTFVKSIDKIGIDKMPQSYQVKYKIAKQRL